MDFSPYRKKGSSSFQVSEYRKYFPIMIVLGGLTVLVLLFFALRAAFSDEGTAVTSSFQKSEGSVVESQISGIDVWSILSDGESITEGDKIRVLSGPASVLTLKNGSQVLIGSGGEILIKSTKQTDDGNFFGEILITSGPVGFEAKGKVDKNKPFIVWIDSNHYIKATAGSFLLQEGMVHVVLGEGIEVVEQNSSGKISNQKLIGVGQSLQISTFTVIATEDSAKFLPLYAQMLSGKATPAETTVATAGDLPAPNISNFTFTGSAIDVTDPLQKVEGTVDAKAQKVIVSFSNGTQTSEQEVALEASDASTVLKKWSYIASPTYDTMASGLNTYKVYAVDASGARSAPALLALQFDTTGENVFDEKGGDLVITAPNQGKNGSIDGNVIIITGTAPKTAAKIVVTNSKLKNPYALQKFKKGDATWKYYTAEMDPGTYGYTVEAYDETGKLLATKKISITVLGATEILKETASATATSSATPTPKITKVPTPAPTVNSSTLEVGR